MVAFFYWAVPCSSASVPRQGDNRKNPTRLDTVVTRPVIHLTPDGIDVARRRVIKQIEIEHAAVRRRDKPRIVIEGQHLVVQHRQALHDLRL